MKILLLTTHLNVGGVGIYTVNLARYLKKKGVDVTVVSSGGDLLERLTDDMVKHVKLDIKTKFEFGIKTWKAVPSLVHIVRSGGFQLLHAQTRVAQVLAYVSGKITEVPFLSTCHGFFKHRRLARRLFPCWGRKVIAISKSVKNHMIGDFSFPSEKIMMIYNGIELERFSSIGFVKDRDLLMDMGLSGDITIVGTTSRLSSVKGLKYLISAFGNVIKNQKDVRLLIIGEGPEKDALEKQIQKLGIQSSVVIASGRASLEKYLLLFDIFCLPSINEGLGLALMEAMAAARPCIASDVGGLSELITNEENGILVPSKDPEALSNAILRMASDSRLRAKLAGNARKRAIENFSIEDSTEKTIKVYEEVIGDIGSRC